MLSSQRTVSCSDLADLASSSGPMRSPPSSPPRCASRLAMRPTLRRHAHYALAPEAARPRRPLSAAQAQAQAALEVDADVQMHDVFVPFAPIPEADGEDESDSDDDDDDGAADVHSTLLFLPPLPAPRPVHACSPAHPSALSPFRRGAPAPGPALGRPSFVFRHAYPHRGLSRPALGQLRYIWGTRKAAWDRWADDAAAAADAARFGLPAHAPGPSPALAWRRAPAAPPGLPPPEREPAESMFPRAGDLHTLRQPQLCARPDWVFRRVPLFRIHKALFVHEMHQRAAAAAAAADADKDADAAPLASPPTSPTLPDAEWERGGSPDSDATLVDGGAPADGGDWRARWHVLADLFAADGKAAAFDTLMRLMVEDAIGAGRVDARPRAKPRFFVPDLDDEDEPARFGGDAEDDSDDEADGYDYGAPLAAPVYGRLASQLETRRRVLAATADMAP